MRRLLYISSLFLLFLTLSGCATKPLTTAASSNPIAQPTPIPEQTYNYINLNEGPPNNASELSYKGFDLVKLKKRVEVDGVQTEILYAVLKHNGRVLATFDKVYAPALGNATDFGLFSFLGGEEKQFFVSQTLPRNGRHWVISLSPKYRIIYDSGDYGVGREDFIVIDVEKDGVYEISQEVTAFYNFENLSNSEVPLPSIIFKYSDKDRKYLPANNIFQDYVLQGIDKEIEELRRSEKKLSDILDIVLQYIYAGKEREAWDFFEREYVESDKAQMKAKILAVLKDEAVYKFLHRKTAT